MTDRVLIVDADLFARRFAVDALTASGFAPVAVGSVREAMRVLGSETPAALVVDPTLPDGDGLELCRELRQAIAGLSVVVVSARTAVEDRVRALDAGADDFVLKPYEPSELAIRVRMLVARNQRTTAPSGPRGRLIACFSPKGGVGTTTICVNTAASLAKRVAETAIVDLVLPLGSVAEFAGIESRETIGGLLRSDGPPITPERVADHFFTKPRLGCQVLPGIRDPRDAQNVDPSRVPPLFEAVRSRYNYVFVDVGRTLSRISMPVLTGADYIIVVLGADPATVKLARACLEFFTAAGITSRRLILVLSRAVGRAGMTRDELSNRLGLPVPVTIPHDPDRFDAALAGGLPLTVREPQTSSAASFEEIIRLFTRAVAT